MKHYVGSVCQRIVLFPGLLIVTVLWAPVTKTIPRMTVASRELFRGSYESVRWFLCLTGRCE